MAMSISEYDLQEAAGVIQTLEMLPKYGNDVELLKKVRKDNKLHFYSRSTT